MFTERIALVSISQSISYHLNICSGGTLARAPSKKALDYLNCVDCVTFKGFFNKFLNTVSALIKKNFNLSKINLRGLNLDLGCNPNILNTALIKTY